MRKICNILSIFILISIMLFTGCSSDYYFKFNNANITISVEQSFNVLDLEKETNMLNYEITSISAENTNLVEINNNIITAVDIGETKIYITVKYEENVLATSFYLTIYEPNINSLGNPESLSYIYEITEIENNISVLELEVYKANSTYSNYLVILNFEDKNNLIFERKYFNYYEVKFYSNSHFTLQINDLFNNKEYLISIN